MSHPHRIRSVRRALGVVATMSLIGAGAFGALPAQAASQSGAASSHGSDSWSDGSWDHGGGWGNWGDPGGSTSDADSLVDGTVTDSAGDPVEGATVVAYDSTDPDGADSPVASTDTDSDGTYELDLSEGSYLVGFVAPGADDPAVYWKDATDIDDATVVEVADGDTVTGIDAALPDTGAIEGTISDSAGDGLDSVTVIAYTYDSDAKRWVRADETSTDDDGTYTFDDVNDGTYRLKFVDDSGRYPSEYYDNVAKLSLAKDITVADADDVTDIDATLSKASFTAAPTPTITGDAVVGQKLTAVAGTWTPTPEVLTYQWYADGTALRHAKRSTLTVTDAMVAKALTVKVTAHRRYYTAVAKTSDATAAVLAEAATTSTPTVTGNATTGGTVAAKVTTVSPAKARVSYQWYANSTAIKGATSARYKVSSKVAGKRLSVKVVAKASGLTSIAHTSAKTRVVR